MQARRQRHNQGVGICANFHDIALSTPTSFVAIALESPACTAMGEKGHSRRWLILLYRTVCS
jgi:hypothetical protein